MLEKLVSGGKPVGDVVISVSHVSKTYKLYPSHQDRLKEALHPFRKRYHEEFSALSDVSFEIRRGESVGILGRNGAGKSTLLQLIAGVITPTWGSVTVNGKVAALLELGAGFNPDLTGRENVILAGTIGGISDEEVKERVRVIEEFADIGIFFDQPMKVYSSGMYARVAFANAIHVDPDVLIVDEILGVGDAKFQEKCHRKLDELRSRNVAILFVSHSVITILAVCERCILLDKGELHMIGRANEVVNAYHGLLYGRSSAELGKGRRPSADSLGSPGFASSPPAAEGEDVPTNASPIVEWLLSDTTLVDRISTRISYNKDHFRTGSGQARILDYIIIVGEEVDARVVRRGAEVEIYLKVKFTEDVPEPVVGLAITKIDGINVYGTNSRLMSLHLTPGRAGDFSVYRFKFSNDLVGGDYFMNFGVSTVGDNGETILLDNLRSVAHLVFEHTREATGMINLHSALEQVTLVPTTC